MKSITYHPIYVTYQIKIYYVSKMLYDVSILKFTTRIQNIVQGKSPRIILRPHRESNLDLIFRRDLFFPLNYKAIAILK